MKAVVNPCFDYVSITLKTRNKLKSKFLQELHKKGHLVFVCKNLTIQKGITSLCLFPSIMQIKKPTFSKKEKIC